MNVSRAEGPQSEAAIAIHPLDPDVLVAGSNSAAEPTMRAYGSTDAGRTWTSTAAPPLPAGSPPGSSSADPIVGIDGSGRQYFGFLRLGQQRAVFVATRAGPDGEWVTPPAPISPPPQSAIDDKPAMAIDNSAASPHRGRVHVVWVRRSTFSIRILATHSDDGGTTWSPPVAVNDDDTFAGFPTVAVGRDGDVLVAWAELSRISIDRSTDGGASFAADRLVARVRPASRTVCRLIPAQPANCVQHNPIVSTDTTLGRHAGSVYVTYSNPTRRIVFDVFAATFDAELEPTRGPALIHRADGKQRSDQFWPASATDPTTGSLWVCYYDTRGDPKRVRATFACTVSRDGARTWAQPSRAASVPSNEAQQSANIRGYGDYEGVAALDGVAYPIWTDSRRMRTLGEEIFTTALLEAHLVP